MSTTTHTEWHPTQHTIDENVAHLCARLTHKTTDQVRGFVVTMTELRKSFDQIVQHNVHAAMRLADAMDTCSYEFRDGPATDAKRAAETAEAAAKTAAAMAAAFKAERDTLAASYRAVMAPFQAERDAVMRSNLFSLQRSVKLQNIKQRELAACNAHTAKMTTNQPKGN